MARRLHPPPPPPTPPTPPPHAPPNAPTPLSIALVSYGEYHANPWNRAIHLVCVPAIFFSLLVGLAYVPAPLPGPLRPAAARLASLAHARLPLLFSERGASAAFLDAPLPFLAFLAYALYYALGLGAPVAGLCWTACVGAPLWLSAVAWAAAAPATAWRWGAALHAAGWVAQIFPGHVLFERRRPALADSFWQAVATAPLFVFVEVMFAAGWNKGLRAEVAAGVEAALTRHRRGLWAGAVEGRR